MARITFITGGARSGKSRFAQQLAEQRSQTPIYLATARIWDDDFAERINRHKSDRGAHWTTVEEEKQLSKHDLFGKTVVLDCITLWLTNIFHDHLFHMKEASREAKEEWIKFIEQDMDLIVVSNELGMGIHPENESARKFVDLQGRINQFIASSANEVFLMVSGIPMKVK